jgi:hypothetical protein
MQLSLAKNNYPMNKKTLTGLLIGLAAGTIDAVLMIIQKLTWDAILGAFSMWIIIGFFLSITQLKIKGVLKGLLISFLVLIPNLFIIGWKEPKSLIPILIMTIILGALSGFIYQKLVKE